MRGRGSGGHCFPLLQCRGEMITATFLPSSNEGKMITATLLSPPRMRRGGGRRPPGWSTNHELPSNHYQNSFEILDYFTILESDQPNSAPLKKPRPDCIPAFS